MSIYCVLIVLNITRQDSVKAFLILGISVFLSYTPITILDGTYNVSVNAAQFPPWDFARDYDCSANCIGPFNFTIDPGADSDAIWPQIQLAVDLYRDGIIPLWDPYLALGTPLAAASILFVYSPMIVFYLLPNYFWDVALLFTLWFAGYFTYLFLRKLDLNFTSSITGSLLFMFSGALTWYLTHDSVLVVLFMPLILYSMELIFQQRNYKNIVLGSLAVSASILGGHLETIMLVFILCMLYFIFRVIHDISYDKRLKVLNATNLVFKNCTLKNIQVILIFLFGIGISSFFILPISEYLLVTGVESHDGSEGLSASPYFTIATTFVPYLLGPIHIYVSPLTNFMASWNVLGGYFAASGMFLVFVAFLIPKFRSFSTLQDRAKVFFLIVSMFFLLKSIGIPMINSIGALPILDSVIFPRYDGFLWTFGFAVVAAIGMHKLTTLDQPLSKLTRAGVLSMSIILSMSLLIIPYFTWDNLAGYYMLVQIFQSLFFIFMFLIVILLKKSQTMKLKIILPLLIFLELTLYIPFGLPSIFQFYRFIVIAIAMLTLIVFIQRKNVIPYQNYLLLIVVLIAVSGQIYVYQQSPNALPIKHEAFGPTDLTNFLDQNLEHFRIFHLDSAFRPNFPAAHQIASIAIMEAQNVGWYNSFFMNNLDPYAITTNFDYAPSWRQPNAPDLATLFIQEKKYYDFLGVKYIVAYQTNPNQPQSPIYGNSHHVIGSNSNIVTQTFVSQVDDITNIAIQLGTYDRINHGEIILTLDSVPYDEKYHRVSKINAESIINGSFNFFEFESISDVKGKKISLTLTHPQQDQNNAVAVFLHDKTRTDPPLDYITDLIKGELYVDGNPIEGIMALSVNSYAQFPLVFKDGGLNVYENKNAYPRAFLVNKFRVTDSYENAQNIIKDPNFDLRNEIVLENNLPTEQIDLLNSSTLENSSTTIVLYSPNKVIINVDSKNASLLVLTDTYYPGWKAYVDGVETEIYRADGLVRAVFVNSGEHVIEFSYMPESFVYGVIISVITACMLTGIYIYSIKTIKSK